MTWRDPRSPRELIKADCDSLRELADAYHPFIRWADQERFFPVLAEAWLQHAGCSPWPGREFGGTSAPAESPIDPHRRGTALCRADNEVTNVTRLAGTPNADDNPIAIDVAELARSLAAFPDADGTWFLNVAGWASDITRAFEGKAGDVEYLFRAFSELSAAINPALLREPIELMSHLPTMWTLQPPTPTVYCEARLASDFAAVSQGLAEPDLPPMAGSGLLSNVLVLTYHYLFPGSRAFRRRAVGAQQRGSVGRGLHLLQM